MEGKQKERTTGLHKHNRPHSTTCDMGGEGKKKKKKKRTSIQRGVLQRRWMDGGPVPALCDTSLLTYRERVMTNVEESWTRNTDREEPQSTQKSKREQRNKQKKNSLRRRA